MEGSGSSPSSSKGSGSAAGSRRTCYICEDSSSAVPRTGYDDADRDLTRRDKALLKDFCKKVLELCLADLNLDGGACLCENCYQKLSEAVETKAKMEKVEEKVKKSEKQLSQNVTELQHLAGLQGIYLEEIKTVKNGAGGGSVFTKALRKCSKKVTSGKDTIQLKLRILDEWQKRKTMSSVVPPFPSFLSADQIKTEAGAGLSSPCKKEPKAETEAAAEAGAHQPKVVRIDSSDGFEDEQMTGADAGEVASPLETSSVSVNPEASPAAHVSGNHCTSSENRPSTSSSVPFSFQPGPGQRKRRKLEVEAEATSAEARPSINNRKKLIEDYLQARNKSEPAIASVFKWLKFSDQQNCREVCKLWMSSTLKHWRSTVALTVGRKIARNAPAGWNPISVEEFYENLNPEEPGQLPAQDLFYQFPEVPFHHFKIKALPLEMFPPYDARLFPREIYALYVLKNTHYNNFFLETCSTTMESLELDFECSFRVNRTLQGIKWILLKACKNLKALSITDAIIMYRPRPDFLPKATHIIFGDGNEDFVGGVAEKLEYLNLRFQKGFTGDDQDWETFSDEVIKMVPNLQKIRLSSVTEFEALGLFLEQLSHPSKRIAVDEFGVAHPKFILLENFDLDLDGDPAPKERLQLLRNYVKNARPPLQEVTLTFNADHVRETVGLGPSQFQQLLSDCHLTLTKLHLQMFWEGRQPKWISELTGTQLPNLTHLTLIPKEFPHQPAPVRFDFRALKNMPKLKVFRAVAVIYDDTMKDNLLSHKGQRELTPAELEMAVNENVAGKADDDHVILKDLEEFSFFLGESFDVECIKRLAVLMPSIKRLGLFGKKSTFLEIGTAWDKLENLKFLNLVGDPVTKQMIFRVATAKNSADKIKIKILKKNEWNVEGKTIDDLIE